MTTTSSAELVASDPIFSDSERFALAGFLVGCSGLTREAYALDLRQFAAWCEQRGMHLFGVRGADIECFGRELEDKGRAQATVARRLCMIAGFYRYAVEEELLEHSPAVHVSRPSRLRVARRRCSGLLRTRPGDALSSSPIPMVARSHSPE